MDFLKIPKIKTNTMDILLKDLLRNMKGVRYLSAMWICGQVNNVDFRPSYRKKYLSNVLKYWASSISEGYFVVQPIVFYTCDLKNKEVITTDNVKSEDFLVPSHYNILLSYLNKKNEFVIERYEPSSVSRQGDLNERLSSLILTSLKGYTSYPLKWELFSNRGLQAKYKDKTLCGHHIIYWVIYRLKYGLEEARKLLNNPNKKNFESFCMCITDKIYEMNE